MTETNHSVLPADFSDQLNRDLFLRELIKELLSVLESTVGLRDSEGFISVVGTQIGDAVYNAYKHQLDQNPESLDHLASLLVDFKNRIAGGFAVEAVTESQIILVNSACPLGPQVRGRTSFCMMTSNVFGRIASEHIGYTSVELAETIARGDDRCRIILRFDPEKPVRTPVTREYYRMVS